MPKASSVRASIRHESPRDHKPSGSDAPSGNLPSSAESRPATGSSPNPSKVAAVTAGGPRKLIRPILPAKTLEDRRILRRLPVLTAQEIRGSAAPADLSSESSHAEMFYLRKQAQSQTPMVFVLEDGEQIEGYIEWYDRHAIKVRNGTRILIYKSSIKYLHKAPQRTGH
jgi:sRNA-binding regulator protein Hfq